MASALPSSQTFAYGPPRAPTADPTYSRSGSPTQPGEYLPGVSSGPWPGPQWPGAPTAQPYGTTGVPQGPGLNGYPIASSSYQGPSPFDIGYNSYLAQSQPDLLALQLQQAAGIRGLGYSDTGYGLSQQDLQNRYASQLGDLNAQIGSNQIDLNAAMRQPGYLDALYAEKQAAAARQPGVISGLFQSNLNQYDLAQQLAGIQATSQRRSLDQQSAASGAFGSTGANQSRDTIYDTLVNQYKNIDESKRQAYINAMEDISRANDTSTELGLTGTEQKAQAQDRIQQLQLEANNLGMKPAQLQATLSNGLAQLGLSHQMSVDQLMDGLARNDLQSMAIYNAAIQSGGQWASAYNQINPSMPTTPPVDFEGLARLRDYLTSMQPNLSGVDYRSINLGV